MVSSRPYSPTERTKERVQATPPAALDVAIIGAGLGGLTAAAYLSRSGLSVGVFDHHYVAGGCGTQFARGGPRNRYNFDVGLHYIGDCGPEGLIPTALTGVGIDLDYIPMDQDGFDTLVFPDRVFPIPANLEVYRDRLLDHFPQERRGIDGYVRLCREFDGVARRLDRQDGKMSLGSLVHVLLRGRSVIPQQSRTMADLLDTLTQDPALRAVILGQNGDYGLPPSQVSALLHVAVAVHYFRGAYYPRGGGQVMADRLAETVEAAGGGVYLRRGVERILVEGGRAVGVRTLPHNGESEDVRARVVISNADLTETMLRLIGPEHLPARVVKRTRGYTMASAIFLTCLGVRADMAARGMRATNYWTFDGYDVEGFYAAAANGDPTPRGAYITSASLKEPDSSNHAPPGVCNVEVMGLVPGGADVWGVDPGDIDGGSYRRSARYQEVKSQVESNLLDRLERLFPGTLDDIVFKESATPITHSRYTRAAGGTGYGIAGTVAQFLKGRPDYRGPLKGFYLCGASARAGHGVAGVLTSGRIVAHLVASDLGRKLSTDQGAS